MNFINGFEKGEPNYILAIDIPTKFYAAKFVKNKDDNFVLKFTTQEYLDPKYFFSRPAILRAPGNFDIFLMNYNALSFSQTVQEPYTIEVTYKCFSTENQSSMGKKARHCAYFKYDKKDFRYTELSLQYEITTHNNQQSSWRNAIKLKVSKENDILVSFEETMPGDDAYFIFRTRKPMDYEIFEKYINATKTAIGILSGYYFGERGYYLSLFEDKQLGHKSPIIIRYKNIAKAVHHDYPILDHMHYEDIDERMLKIKAEQFNKLINILVRNEDFERALRLLIDAAVLDNQSSGAIAAVALESISNNLAEKGPASKIIKDAEIASKLKYELGKVSTKIKPLVPKDEYNKIESKISSINIQPNAVKLESSFEKMEIHLSEEEKFCISCRNTFLHGGLPNNKALSNLSKDEQIFVVSHQLIMLSAILILKQAGYDGLVNDWGHTSIVKKRAILEGHPMLNAGNVHRKME